MKPIYNAWLCQIDITNVCSQRCAYCTRYIRHIRKDQKFNMSIDMFKKALLSLKEWPKRIGIIGGEPTLHPQFEEICKAIGESDLPKEKFGLFTSGGKNFKKYKELIKKNFSFIAYNEHNEYQKKTCFHQPLTIAIDDVVEDKEYKEKLIDNCWVQKFWCPTIIPKGAFFCEVAGALDIILDGPGGYPIEPNWWRKKPEDFQDQVRRYCGHCGAPVPIDRELLSIKKERFSSGLLKLFKEHNLPSLSDRDITLFDKKLTIQEMEKTKLIWDPANYKGDRQLDLKNGWRRRG